MSLNDDQKIELLGWINTYLFQYGGILLYIVGNVGTILCMMVFSIKSWRKNVCVFYFLVGLICNLIFINGGLLGTILINGFGIALQNVNNGICKLFFYISYVCSTYFPTILILASIDRLLISSQKVDTRLYSSRRLAYFSIITSALLWTLFSIHVLIKVGIQEVYPTVFVCYYETSAFYLDFFSYSVLVISVAIPLIMIILSILAFKNVRRIRAIPRAQRKQVRSMSKKDFQLLRCLYIHNIIYIIFSLLIGFSIVYGRILKYRTVTRWDQALDAFLNNLGSFLHYIPYCTSFLLFFATSRAFRQELKRYVYRAIGKDFATIRDEDNHQVDKTVHENPDAMNIAAISTVALRE